MTTKIKQTLIIVLIVLLGHSGAARAQSSAAETQQAMALCAGALGTWALRYNDAEASRLARAFADELRQQIGVSTAERALRIATEIAVSESRAGLSAMVSQCRVVGQAAYGGVR